MLLQNKTAVITGCNRGIGRAILESFVEHGSRVFACVRSETDEFKQLIHELTQKHDAKIIPIYFDLTDEAQLKSAVATIAAETKQIDILVNNAGIASGSIFQMTPMKDLRKLFDVNFFAQLQWTQAMIRYMTKSGAGSIINVASTAALIGDPGTLAYGSSKAALAFATKTLASELGRFNVRVNAIAPSVTKTDMFHQMDEKAVSRLVERSALKRPAEPVEIANVALFLASDLASYISGQVLRVDGGMTT